MSRMPAKKSRKMLAPRIASPMTRPRYSRTRRPSTLVVVVQSIAHISWLLRKLFRRGSLGIAEAAIQLVQKLFRRVGNRRAGREDRRHARLLQHGIVLLRN